MITTKGIIEKVEIKDDVVQYRVRMPLFHETQNSSNITTNNLPLALYPLPPHMEKTILRVGDVVCCTLEDGGLDNVIILGLIPKSSIPNTSGSNDTTSKVSMEHVGNISFSIDGTAILPYKTRVIADEHATELIVGQNRNYIDGKDLSYIKGLSEPLIVTLTRLQEMIDYLEETLIHLEVNVEVLDEGIE